MMKQIYTLFFITTIATGLHGQSLRSNLPLWAGGAPSMGVEFTLTRQLTVGGEAFWMPYLWKRHEEVFRVFMATAELRYYLRPRDYYTNDSWAGWYVGPYALYGDFNVGLLRHGNALRSYRRKGWGVSGGVLAGYKWDLSARWALDFNVGVGYAHLQYDKYYLGGEYARFPLERKRTAGWIGPTRLGVYLVYNLFR